MQRFLAGQRQVPKFTAALSFAELPRAVRRANHDPAVSPGTGGDNSDADNSDADNAVLAAELRQAPEVLATLRVVEVTRALLADSALADGPMLRTVDAIHLVAAARLALGLTAFVTYDKRLAAAVRQAGLPVTAPS